MISESVMFHNVAETSVEPLKDLLGEQDVEGVGEPSFREAVMAERAEGLVLLRIPDSVRRGLNPSARIAAVTPAGCELRFALAGDSASVTLKSIGRPSIAEVYWGPLLASWHVIQHEPTTIRIDRPPRFEALRAAADGLAHAFDVDIVRVALPWWPACRLLDVSGDVSPPDAAQLPARRLMSYGSSITHGNRTCGPKDSWAAKTAQRLGMDHFNLGFGGGAHLERSIADHIAGRDDWDVATLEMGINVIGKIEVDEFAHRVEYFIGRLAEAKPGTPIFCIDIFTCERDLSGDAKIAAFRRSVEDAVAALGSPSVVHVRGDEMLSFGGLTVDLVHPSPTGMDEIAGRMAELMRPRIA